jgi:cytochrome b subunit of formate dehydrogenase
MVLVYTGFALKYPESWWASPLLTWESDFGLRGWLHRVAAVVIMGALGWHFVHLTMSRRARRCIAQMLPGLGDLREFRDRMAYYFGLRADEPPVPNVGYVEKAEYLAFMWGMVVMAATGFLLWFETLALQWLPKWASDAATTIHWYEAILASLAILVWHFYWVIFDPVVYPMDLTWLTGKPPAARAAERSGEIETHADRAERRANRRGAG